jgi:WD40-like Beta Propeller Repeat
MRRFLLACVAVGLVATSAWLSRSPNEPAREPAPTGALRAFGPVHPRLAPAGDRVVFSCQAALWVMPAAGGTMTRLTGGGGFDSEPVWSPDGQHIAYLNGREVGAGQVRVIRAEDGAPVAGPDGVQATGKLAFHPDGRRLLGSLRAPDLLWLLAAPAALALALAVQCRRAADPSGWAEARLAGEMAGLGASCTPSRPTGWWGHRRRRGSSPPGSTSPGRGAGRARLAGGRLDAVRPGLARPGRGQVRGALRHHRGAGPAGGGALAAAGGPRRAGPDRRPPGAGALTGAGMADER